MQLWWRTLLIGVTGGIASNASAASDFDLERVEDGNRTKLSDTIDPGRLLDAPPEPGTAPASAIGEAQRAEADATKAHADQPPPPTAARNRHELSIGIGGGVVPSYVGSNNYVFTPGLAIRGKVHNFSFSSRGTNLTVDLAREKPGADTDIIFGPAFNYRADRTRRISDAQVRLLGRVDAGWEVGAWMGIRQKHVFFKKGYDTVSFRTRIVREIGGGHGSTMISPSIDYGLALSPSLFVAASASADRVGKGFGRTYFNITPAGSLASGLPVYTAAGQKGGWMRSSFNLVAAKSLSGGLNDKGWSFVALASIGRLHGRYKDSPIVSQAGSKRQRMFGAGIAYTF